jgi:hypothetical protein
MSSTDKLLDAARSLPDKFIGTNFDGGTIRKVDTHYGKSGDVCTIMPCDPKHGKETFIGVLVGEWFADPESWWYGEYWKKGNPIIYVFKLKTFVRGCESYWGVIPPSFIEGKTCDQLLDRFKITPDVVKKAIEGYMDAAIAKALDLPVKN